MFSTCFHTSFLSRDFPFCTDSLHTGSYLHLSLHTRHLFAEIANQITQVPREFDTWFLSFYTTCAIRCTCRKRTQGSKTHGRKQRQASKVAGRKLRAKREGSNRQKPSKRPHVRIPTMAIIGISMASFFYLHIR